MTGKRKANSGDSSDESDTDLLNVDFEWFDPQEIDFHGLKTLLRQLFDVDNQLLDLSGLANLILSQPLLGSTVKIPDDEVETNQTDPYAFLTVLNLHEHREISAIQSLTRYLTSKSNNTTPEQTSLEALLSPTSSSQVGLILTERFLNMPPQIVPPMYKMLLEEISWAVAEKEPYAFTHYLILSKTYTEVASQLPSNGAAGAAVDEEDETSSGPQKKKSKKSQRQLDQGSNLSAAGNEIFYFHPEDEILHQYAVWHSSFEYTKQGDAGASDAKRAFQDAGIRPVGHLILIDAQRFAEAVEGVEQALSGGA